MQKISIILDESSIAFIDSQSSNRSQYINSLIKKLQQEQQIEELKQAYITQAQDPEEITEIAFWDCTVGDGIE